MIMLNDSDDERELLSRTARIQARAVFEEEKEEGEAWRFSQSVEIRWILHLGSIEGEDTILLFFLPFIFFFVIRPRSRYYHAAELICTSGLEFVE